MLKHTKHMIRASLFALSLLTGLPGCIRRTGTLYCDTIFSSICGIKTLCNGASFFGEGNHHSALSLSIGSFLTLKALLFSWWWDTLCIPHDIYLKFDGVDFYVYDQDGQPIPDVMIQTYGEASLYEMKKKTDAKGHLYYPRRVMGFRSLSAQKDGYRGGEFNGTVWLIQYVNAGVPQIFKPRHRNEAVIIPTTNSMHTLNIFMEKMPAK